MPRRILAPPTLARPSVWLPLRKTKHVCLISCMTVSCLMHVSTSPPAPRPCRVECGECVECCLLAWHAAPVVPLRAPWSLRAANGARPCAACAGVGLARACVAARGGFQAAENGAVVDAVPHLGRRGGVQRRKRMCVARFVRGRPFAPDLRRAAPRRAGSTAGFYYLPANGTAMANVWLIYLEGGQWCAHAARGFARAACRSG